MRNVFGFSTAPSEGGDFMPIVKYDARAGRMFRIDRIENNGSFENKAIDITESFKAIVDLATAQSGWILFASSTAPDFRLVPIGEELPARPSDKHKNGVRCMIKLSKDCGGEKPIRELAGTSKALLSGMEVVFMQYLAEKNNYPGKLPVIVLEKTTLVTTGTGDKRSTNYHPVFKITGWAPCGDLGVVTSPVVQANSNPPATGSTRSGAPIAAETVDSEEFR